MSRTQSDSKFNSHYDSMAKLSIYDWTTAYIDNFIYDLLNWNNKKYMAQYDSLCEYMEKHCGTSWPEIDVDQKKKIMVHAIKDFMACVKSNGKVINMAFITRP